MGRLLATLVASVVSGEAADAVARARSAAIAYVLAGLFALCGLGFLVGAAYAALAREVGTIAAALWFGGGFVLLALIIVVVQRIGARTRARKIAKRRGSEMRTVASTAAIALLPTLLAGRGRVAVLTVPALAALAYAVWRENAPRDGRDPPPPSA